MHLNYFPIERKCKELYVLLIDFANLLQPVIKLTFQKENYIMTESFYTIITLYSIILMR